MLSSSSSKYREKEFAVMCLGKVSPTELGMRDFPYLNARIRDFKGEGKVIGVGGGGGGVTWD